jgi:hypothetical protein
MAFIVAAPPPSGLSYKWNCARTYPSQHGHNECLASGRHQIARKRVEHLRVDNVRRVAKRRQDTDADELRVPLPLGRVAVDVSEIGGGKFPEGDLASSI